jgi:uncharacterized membrane protein
MWRRLALSFAVLAIAALTTVSPSNAEFRVCNKSTQRLDVAIGYDGGRQGWIAEGWWVIDVNKCTTVKGGDLNSRNYYLYATNNNGSEWIGSDGEGGAPFCVKVGKVFTLYQRKYGDNRDEDCKKAGLDSKSFLMVDVGEYRRWTHTLENEVVAAPNPPPRPNPPPIGGGGGGGNACQRFPNLC